MSISSIQRRNFMLFHKMRNYLKTFSFNFLQKILLLAITQKTKITRYVRLDVLKINAFEYKNRTASNLRNAIKEIR